MSAKSAWLKGVRGLVHLREGVVHHQSRSPGTFLVGEHDGVAPLRPLKPPWRGLKGPGQGREGPALTECLGELIQQPAALDLSGEQVQCDEAGHPKDEA